MFPEKRVLASCGGLPCLSHPAQVAACGACYQVIFAQNGQKRRARGEKATEILIDGAFA